MLARQERRSMTDEWLWTPVWRQWVSTALGTTNSRTVHLWRSIHTTSNMHTTRRDTIRSHSATRI